jgi:hypothetical protein
MRNDQTGPERTEDQDEEVRREIMVRLNVLMMAMDMVMARPGSERACAGTGRLSRPASR